MMSSSACIWLYKKMGLVGNEPISLETNEPKAGPMKTVSQKGFGKWKYVSVTVSKDQNI